MGNDDQTGICSALPVFEIILSFCEARNRDYYGSLLCYLAELRLPTDESHCIKI